MSRMRVDLPLDGMDVFDRGEIEVLAPDEWLQVREELRARFRIAGTLARLDPGGALPILPHALVIELGRFGRDRDLSRARIGPQPQIDPEHVAVRSRFSQQPDQPLDD